MHPDLLRALAKARQDDLLNTHSAREKTGVTIKQKLPLFSSARRRLGSLLIRMGARLIGDGRAAVELAHE
jgi:hypothetical protein